MINNVRVVIKTLTLGLSLLTAFSSTESFAWGQNGHRIIGEVAQMHLTQETKKQLSLILKDDSLAEVSTWPDEMRSNPSTFWQKQSGKWHYINVNGNNLHNHAKPHTNNKDGVKNILDGIYFSINQLSSKSTTQEQKRFALSFLVHLIGDSHQPFHAGRKKDRGGNLIKVRFFGEETNLHSTWDTRLIENQRLSYIEFAKFIKTSNKRIINDYLKSEPADWLLESHKIAESVYNENETDISYSYIYKYMPIVKERLLQGGIRLAGTLNLIFDNQAEPLINALQSKSIAK